MEHCRRQHSSIIAPTGEAVRNGGRFGALLRRHRLAAGLTQRELARRAGLSLRAITALELGERRAPHPVTLARLASAMNLGPEDRAAFEASAHFRPAVHATRERPLVLVRAPPAPPPHNLPLPPAPLLGRERELAELTVLVPGEKTRLITLTGPGGVGKTRLALEVAWTLQQASNVFPDGIWFVRLAPLTDPSLVIATIAQALGLHETGGVSFADRLRAFLGTTSLLLVLDNFEQVVGAAPHIAGLLEASAGVRVLVTSRAPLHLRGERAYPVGLLPMPTPRRGRLAAEQLDQYAATALFLERARAVRPDFPVTDASAPHIAGICARLDGLPLGIELAAIWARLLSPAALLAQLERRLSLLSDGPVDLPARQRTMRAAIAWSYDLLDAESQRLFGRLAVFTDGWTVDAATVVCQSPLGAAPLRRDILSGLSALLDSSLIVQHVHEDGDTAAARLEMRLEMLHVVREFALEQLEASGEAETIRRAHALYVLPFAEAAEPELRGPNDFTWMKQVERELGDVRAALEWAREHAAAEVGLRIAAALGRFWLEAGYVSEGLLWFETLLALAPPAGAVRAAEEPSTSGASSPQVSALPAWLRARALTTSALLAAALRQIGPALAALEAWFSLARATDDWPSQVFGLLLLGAFADLQGEPRRAQACYEEVLALGRARADTLTIITALVSLAGLACEEQRWAEATARATEALTVVRAAGWQQYVATYLLLLGEVALCQGEAPRSAALLGEALAVALGMAAAVATMAIGPQSTMAAPAQALATCIGEPSTPPFKPTVSIVNSDTSQFVGGQTITIQGYGYQDNALLSLVVTATGMQTPVPGGPSQAATFTNTIPVTTDITGCFSTCYTLPPPNQKLVGTQITTVGNPYPITVQIYNEYATPLANLALRSCSEGPVPSTSSACGPQTLVQDSSNYTPLSSLEQHAEQEIASLRGISNDTTNDYFSRGEIRAQMFVNLMSMINACGASNSTGPNCSSSDQAVVAYYGNLVESERENVARLADNLFEATGPFCLLGNTSCGWASWKSNPCFFLVPLGFGAITNGPSQTDSAQQAYENTVCNGPPNNPFNAYQTPTQPSYSDFTNWAAAAIFTVQLEDWATGLMAVDHSYTAQADAVTQVQSEYLAAIDSFQEGVQYLTLKHTQIPTLSSTTPAEQDLQAAWIEGLGDFSKD